MRRARASAQALVAIGLLLAILAGAVAAGAAPTAGSAGGGGTPTPPPCPQGSRQVPPPVCRVNVDLNAEPRIIPGSVSTTNAIEYVVKGRAGDRYSLAVTDMPGEFCFVFPGLDLTFSTPAGQLIETAEVSGCGAYGPWTIPAGGSVVVRVQTTGDPIPYRFRFGRVEFEDVRARLRNGAVRLTGRINVALDGVDYVLNAPPGDKIVLDFPISECDAPSIAQNTQVLDSAEQDLGFRRPGCFNAGPWTVPADGIVKIRVQNLGLLASPYNLTVELRRFPRQVVASDRESVEVTGAISRPFDGVDFVVDTTDVDRLTVSLLGDSAGGCDFGTPVLPLDYALMIDGVEAGANGFSTLACGQNGWVDLAGLSASSVTIRVFGFSYFEESVTPGTFRLAIGRLHFDDVAVDVRGGPVATASDLTYSSDETHYEVTATPGRLVSAFDPTQRPLHPSCDSSQPGLELNVIEWLDDPTIPFFGRFCGPFGPFRVPPSGVVRFNAITGPGRLLPPGPYQLTIAEFDYESVPVDLSTGSVTVAGQVAVPLDGTDYVITGRPGDRVQLTFDQLDAPASCADPRSLPLLVEVYDSRWLFPDNRWEVWSQGCQGMPPVAIGADGRLVFRVRLMNMGNTGLGSYSATFSRPA